MSEPRVKYRKLGKHRADGLFWDELILIEIDPTLPAKRELEVFVHEYTHHLHPEWSEKRVTSEAKKLCNFLWRQGFRKVKTK